MNPRLYEQLHALASKNLARGRKWNYQFYVRLNPDNPTEVQMGYYARIWVDLLDKPGSYKSIEPKYRPFISHITFSPKGAMLHMPGIFERYEYKFSPKALIAYPDLRDGFGPYKRVDITLNNLLDQFRYKYTGTYVFHSGTNLNKYPGFDWTVRKDGVVKSFRIAGPVFFDFETYELVAVNPQPERVISVDRDRATKALRRAFDKVKRLVRFGVETNTDDMLDLFMAQGPVPEEAYNPQDYKHRERLMIYAKPETFLDWLEQTELDSSDELLRLYLHIACLAAPDYKFSYGGSTVESMMSSILYHAQYSGALEFSAPKDLVRVRRQLHSALGVVRFET